MYFCFNIYKHALPLNSSVNLRQIISLNFFCNIRICHMPEGSGLDQMISWYHFLMNANRRSWSIKLKLFTDIHVCAEPRLLLLV